MTAAASLSARQTGAGAPIKARGRTAIYSAAEYLANSDNGIGVKIGATPPTNVSEFAATFKHYEAGAVAVQSTRQNVADGTIMGVTYVVQHVRTIPLSATVVAGRYLFTYLEGAAGALQAVSPGYLIT